MTTYKDGNVTIELDDSLEWEERPFWEWMMWDWYRHKRRWEALPWSMRLLMRLHIIGYDEPNYTFTYTKEFRGPDL